MARVRGRLAETGLFSSAAVRLGEDTGAAANGEAPRDVVVELTERERRTIAIGASASTCAALPLAS